MFKKPLILALIGFALLIAGGKVLSYLNTIEPVEPLTVRLVVKPAGRVVTFHPHVIDAEGRKFPAAVLPNQLELVVTDLVGNEVHTGRFKYG